VAAAPVFRSEKANLKRPNRLFSGRLGQFGKAVQPGAAAAVGTAPFAARAMMGSGRSGAVQVALVKSPGLSILRRPFVQHQDMGLAALQHR
jgi:hypothetical protein